MDFIVASAIVVGAIVMTASPLVWTVRRILRPIDQAARARKAPFRFSIGDFLCLFWVIQLPLAMVFQIEGEETAIFYWVLTVAVWAMAPLVWVTCAAALSQAGVTKGKHRFIFLAVVVPTVYYGLFPFIGLCWIGIATLVSNGPRGVFENPSALLAWIALAAALVLCGFYSPWLVRQVESDLPPVSERKSQLQVTPEPRSAKEPSVSELQRRLRLARDAVKRHSPASPTGSADES